MESPEQQFEKAIETMFSPANPPGMFDHIEAISLFGVAEKLVGLTVRFPVGTIIFTQERRILKANVELTVFIKNYTLRGNILNCDIQISNNGADFGWIEANIQTDQIPALYRKSWYIKILHVLERFYKD